MIASATVKWVKGELIGKGSYGRVYIALNVSSSEWMAVKQVELPRTDWERNDKRQMGMIEALQSEIALLKDLYHPNIVAYLGELMSRGWSHEQLLTEIQELRPVLNICPCE